MSSGTYNFEIFADPGRNEYCRVRDLNMTFFQEYIEAQGIHVETSAWVVDHGEESGVRTKERNIKKSIPNGDLVKGYRMSATYQGQILALSLEQTIPTNDSRLESIAGKLSFEANASDETGFDIMKRSLGQISLMGYRIN